MKSRVIVEITAGRVEAAILSGAQLTSAAANVASLPQEAEHWAASLDALEAPLGELVKKLGARGLPATVIYHAPTTAIGVFSCPKVAHMQGAIQAAMLSLAESASFALDENPADVQIISRDPSAAEGEPAPQLHTLAAADLESSVASLSRLCSKVGVKLDRIVPIDALAMSYAVRAALARAGSQRVSLVFYVGEHTAVLAAAERGRLSFVRQVGIGVDTLVHAMTREIKLGNASGSVTLDATSALNALCASGIPRRDDPAEICPGLRAEHILPLLQPIIQRTVVDMRQSVRFGLSEAARKDARITVIGPGARIPRLAEVVAEQVGLPLDPAEATGSAQPPVSRVSALPLIALPKSATINILPKDLREQALVKRATRGLIAGTAAVLAFMAITGARIHAEVGTLRATLASERASAEAVKPLLILEEQAQSSTRVLTQAMLRIRDKASTTPRWDAALAMLSQAAPESVRLSSVTMGLDGPTPTIRIQGRTVMPDRVDSGTALKLFLDGLTGIPIVHAARLGATQRQETPAGVSQTFDMSVQLVAVPTADWIETVAASRPVATVPVSPGERP